MPDLYGDYETEEDRLRTLIWGAGGVGVLYALQQLPARLTVRGELLSTAQMIRRNPSVIAQSVWWRRIWLEYQETVGSVLAKVSSDAASPLLRRYAARLASTFQERAIERLAFELAAVAAAEIEAATQAGMVHSALIVRQQKVSGAIARRLAERLGPTEAQVRMITRWEQRAIADGALTQRQIRLGVRRRSRAAALARARTESSNQVVAVVSRSREGVFAAAGVRVFSANPLDNRTRDLHRRQTAATRADPRPAGDAWTPSAPFRGLPPYEHACRCGVDAA